MLTVCKVVKLSHITVFVLEYVCHTHHHRGMFILVFGCSVLSIAICICLSCTKWILFYVSNVFVFLKITFWYVYHALHWIFKGTVERGRNVKKCSDVYAKDALPGNSPLVHMYTYTVFPTPLQNNTSAYRSKNCPLTYNAVSSSTEQ